MIAKLKYGDLIHRHVLPTPYNMTGNCIWMEKLYFKWQSYYCFRFHVQMLVSHDRDLLK